MLDLIHHILVLIIVVEGVPIMSLAMSDPLINPVISPKPIPRIE
jgi:hypothetical protein